MTRPQLSDLIASVVLAFSLAACIAVGVTACSGHPTTPANTTAPTVTNKPLEAMNDKELKAHADKLTRQLAEAQKQIELNRLAHVRKVLYRVAAGFGLLAVGCIALVIWTPFKKQGLIGAVAALGLAAGSLFAIRLVPWLDLIGAGVLLALLVAAGMVIKGLVKRDKMVTGLVTGTEAALYSLEPKIQARVKELLAEAQDKLGVREGLRAARRKLGL